MIYLGKITIEEFGSVEHAEYNFNRRGLNTILGLNGAGKTSFFNALSWVLYKQLLKKNCTIEPWPQFITENYKGTKVTLDMWDDNNKYEIIRCQNYTGKVLGKSGKNRLVFLINGKEVKDKGKSNIQQEIIKVIGYSFDLFKTAVVFGQKMRRFIEEDGPNQKKVFEEAFESAFISRAKDIVQKRYEQKLKDYDRANTEAKAYKSIYLSSRLGLRELVEIARVFKETQLKKIQTLSQEIKGLKKQIEVWESDSENKNLPKVLRTVEAKEDKVRKRLQKYQSREFDYTLRINRSNTEIDRYEKTIESLKQQYMNIPTACSKCGQDLPKSKIKGYKERIKEDLQAARDEAKAEKILLNKLIFNHEKCKNSIKALEAKMGKIKLKLIGYSKAKLEQENITSKIKTNWALYYDKEKQIEAIRKEKAPGKNIPEKKRLLRNSKQDWSEANLKARQLLKEVNVDKWLLHDPLSNSGLKAFIFESMLSKVNNYLKGYKSLIGFEVKVSIDLKSARKGIGISMFKNGDEVPYEDLSGGQGQLVGVVMLFALNDTVNSAKPINILLMDEAFESLDKINIPIVESIILKKAKNKAIHLITHNENFNPVGAYRTQLELINGRTKVISRFRDN
jgi:DNA repair exonuclease SbcCD ATPase subunit